MTTFSNNVLYNFLIAFGVIIGASSFAGIGAILNNHPTFKTMVDMANSLKIWAVAVALGGTFSSFEIIEQGLIKGDIRTLVKQMIFIIVALIGANLGYGTIKLIQKCGTLWIK